MKLVLLVLLLFLQPISSAFAFGDTDYFCSIGDVKSKTCQKGDVLVVPNAIVAAMYCLMDKPAIATAQGAACIFRGEKRKKR